MQVMRGNIFIPVNQNANAGAPNKQDVAVNASLPQGTGSFGDILSKKVTESDSLQFSKHAEMRLKSRDITLSADQMQRAMDGVNKARVKGIRDSLVLVDDVALVVNTKSNVVITALQGSGDNVFTNIDGAVIA